VDLNWRIDAAADRNVFNGSVGAGDAQGEVLLRPQIRVQAEHVVNLRAVEVQRLRGDAFLKLKGQHAGPDEVRAVDSCEGLRDDGLDAQQRRAFGRPVARTASA